MVFHIFGLSGLEQADFFHNPRHMNEALPLSSMKCFSEATPFFICGLIRSLILRFRKCRHYLRTSIAAGNTSVAFRPGAGFSGTPQAFSNFALTAARFFRPYRLLSDNVRRSSLQRKPGIAHSAAVFPIQSRMTSG